MKRMFVLSALLFVGLLASSQNDANWASKDYETGNFNRLYIKGGYKVFLSQGEKCGLTVKATGEDVFDVLRVENSGNELYLAVERKSFDFDRINLYITFKKLEEVKIEGGITLNTEGFLDLNDLSMEVEGGAKIDLKLKADDLRIVARGGMLMRLSGVAKRMDAKLTGAGSLNAEELKTRDVAIFIEGVGTGSVYAERTLDARIEGVGKIVYTGKPRVTEYIDGLGSVKEK